LDKTLAGTVDSNEINIIVKFAGEKEPDEVKSRIENLTRRVNHLKLFEELSKSMSQNLEDELTCLK